MIDVSPDQLSIILHILRRHAPDYEVRVFGSRYKWTAKEFSDLDLVLVGNEPMHWKKIAEIKGEFEESGLPFRVDVLDWHAISPEFKKVILDGGFEVIQEKDGDFQPKGWQSIKLKDLCSKIGSGATPRGGKETYLDEGDYALIRSQNILDFFFSHDGLAFINDEQAKQLSNVEVQERDVLLNITGDSVARVCQPPSNVLPARVNQHVAIIRADQSKLLPEFLKYYLLNPSYKNYLLSLASVGATRNALTKGMIEDLDIDLPSLETQRRIADILSALDEKIELNRQTNATLEAIAQSIFREWFVEFNYPNATGEMVESELGMLPKGWKVLPLDEIADFLNGLALQKFPAENEKDYLPVIKIRELKNGVSNSSDKASRNIQSKYIINDGDLIFSWSGTLEVKFWVGGEGALNQHLFKVTSKEYPLWFCYFWILEHLANFRGIAEDKTTTMGHIQRHHLSEALCYVPDNLTELDKIMKPLVDKIINLNQQSATLATIRDQLLPKLMSGEIEITNN